MRLAMTSSYILVFFLQNESSCLDVLSSNRCEWCVCGKHPFSLATLLIQGRERHSCRDIYYISSQESSQDSSEDSKIMDCHSIVYFNEKY